MDILRDAEAERAEQLQVYRQRCQPLLAADNDGRAHEMVIHGVGEVVGRDAVGLQQDLIDVVFRNGERALDQIAVFEFVFNGAGGAEAQHPRLACGNGRLDILDGTVTPYGIFAVVAKVDLFGLLLGAHGSQLLLGTEAGVGITLQDELLGVDVVDRGALALAIGAVSAGIAVDGRALVKVDAIVLQRVDEHLHGARHLALGVRILHAEEQHAAGLVRHALGDKTLHKVAQMDKARGGGSHAGNDRALGKVAGGITRLKVFRRFRHVREEQGGKSFLIHNNTSVSF